MTPWMDLAKLAQGNGQRGLVGLAPGQDWAALMRAREAWSAAVMAAGARRVALYCTDTFEFAGALLGIWSAGATAVLPGDATEITTAGLRSQVDAFVGEFPASVAPGLIAAASSHRAAATSGSTQPARPFPELPLVLFTSGSTGVPIAVSKTRSDLENELRGLQAALGADLRAERVLSTVSHQHIYGLLFRCLWPLACGRPFAADLIRFPEELADRLGNPGTALLVASPAFLKRMHQARSLEQLPHPPETVFSSGGPLAWDAAEACARMFASYPIEIYGSTETGGIAWRRRNREDQAWTPFSGVVPAIAEDGTLSLTASPYVSSPLPMATGDLARMEGGSLRLLGRADRIVKLEEKRLSLTAMEALLARHPRMAEARLLVLPGERETLAAVLRLDDGSVPLRGSAEREALVRELREHLAQGFERVLLPRRWRIVAALPVNAAGKTTQALLAELFRPLLGPCITAERRGESGATLLDLDIHPELEHFRGHFPEGALLPGVVQLDWAIREGQRRFGPFGAFRGLRVLKFQRPITPGMRVTLELTHLPAKGAIAFAYDSAAGRHAAGQAIFAPVAA